MKSLDELEAIARARNEALWGWWRVEDLPKVYAELQADAPFIAAMSPDTALKLIAVVKAAKELAAVAGKRAEYMQDELSAVCDAVAALSAMAGEGSKG